MTLEQLRIFVAVAECEHVTRAAGTLHLTQSAVSAAIRSLEARHGIALFHRVGRRIELTQAGRVFRAEAVAVLARAEAAELVLSELGGTLRGTLRIQASQTVASYWLPPLLVRFGTICPEVTVEVVAGNTSSVAHAVEAGAAELGLVEGEVDNPLLDQTILARDQLIVVTAPGHVWAGGGHLEAERMFETSWVLRESGSGTRAAFEVWLREHGLLPERLQVTLELPSNEAVLAAVQANNGATVVSERAAGPHLAAGLLVRCGVTMPPRSFKALRHRERYASRASRALVELALR
ncbi:LysR family transcriptional regulator [Pseudoroseomonas globiformis]|uniref:LysR family transcriptional regulator n=1 Tax=Teichococcus globiformis TaxID=2307229 RepID=A0ABV7FZX9_9PROT